MIYKNSFTCLNCHKALKPSQVLKIRGKLICSRCYHTVYKTDAKEAFKEHLCNVIKIKKEED